jgi:3-hydroxyacyl-[acyl-carrier-protein] dehydratase
MNRKEIEKILPHREGMLLLDEAVVEDGIARAKKAIVGDEWFLQGHFPGQPVVPGVILCEILGQSACVLFPEALAGKTPFFTGIKNARFRKPVVPGDVFCTEVQLVRQSMGFFFLKAKGYVDGELSVEVELSFAIV